MSFTARALPAAAPTACIFFWHSMGNRMLTLLSNMLTNLNLSDMEVGYKVFRAEVLKGIDLKSKRFGFEPEITVKLAKKGCRFYEVPISYHGRTYEEGKKITWKDGVAALYYMIRFRLRGLIAAHFHSWQIRPMARSMLRSCISVLCACPPTTLPCNRAGLLLAETAARSRARLLRR